MTDDIVVQKGDGRLAIHEDHLSLLDNKSVYLSPLQIAKVRAYMGVLDTDDRVRHQIEIIPSHRIGEDPTQNGYNVKRWKQPYIKIDPIHIVIRDDWGLGRSRLVQAGDWDDPKIVRIIEDAVKGRMFKVHY